MAWLHNLLLIALLAVTAFGVVQILRDPWD
jgi:hypothetical protein